MFMMSSSACGAAEIERRLCHQPPPLPGVGVFNRSMANFRFTPACHHGRQPFRLGCPGAGQSSARPTFRGRGGSQPCAFHRCRQHVGCCFVGSVDFAVAPLTRPLVQAPGSWSVWALCRPPSPPWHYRGALDQGENPSVSQRWVASSSHLLLSVLLPLPPPPFSPPPPPHHPLQKTNNNNKKKTKQGANPEHGPFS